MPKGQKIIFMGNGGQPNPSARPAIIIPASKLAVVKLTPINSEGGVSRVVIYQVQKPQETMVPFTVELLDSGLPYNYAVDPANWPQTSDPPLADLRLFRIIDPLVVTVPGDTAKFFSTGVAGIPYINADQPDSTRNIRALWLIIKPQWSDPPTVTTFEGYLHFLAPLA